MTRDRRRNPIRRALRLGVLLLAACIARQTSADPADDALDAIYLARNAQAFDPAAADFRLDREFLRGRVFLLGEVHGIAHGQAVDLALLRHLHRRAGVRVYAGEFDFAQAAAFNRFLDDGRPDSLEPVFAYWRSQGLQWANAEFRAKLLAIREWNETLPSSERIRFFGADEIQDPAGACRQIAEWLPATRKRDSAQRLAALVGQPDECARPGALAAAAAAVDLRVEPEWRAPDLRDALAALAVEASVRDREERIAANLRRRIERADGARVYGLWGLFHVVQARVNGARPMAHILASAGVTTRSILMLNVDAAMMLPSRGEDGRIGYAPVNYTVDSEEAALVAGIEPLKRASRGPFTLFRLDARGSPYPRSTRLARVGGGSGACSRSR